MYLHKHLQKLSKEAKWCKSLVLALHESLRKRFCGIDLAYYWFCENDIACYWFCGIFVNSGIEKTLHEDESYPFKETLHLIATVLNPMCKLLWFDRFVLDYVDIDLKKPLESQLITVLIAHFFQQQ